MIRPAEMRAPILQGGENSLTVKWKAQRNADYTIKYRKSGTQVYETVKVHTGDSSCIIRGLEAGARYDVKIRARKEIGGTNYLGAWNDVAKETVR